MATLSNTEKEINVFITRLPFGNILQTVEIHEVDMCGWRLFECFWANTVAYVSWDEDAAEPEWIDMEDDVEQEYASILMQAIGEQQRSKAA
jgi:hypothetical protein